MNTEETPVTPQNGRHAELIRRIGENLDEYHASLMLTDKRGLIEMAGRIHAMSDAYSYLRDSSFEGDELDFLLKFKNPLEIVAEGWMDHNIDIDDVMGFAFGDVMRRKDDWLASYPLVDEVSGLTGSGPRRFMDVTLLEFASKVAPSTSARRSDDWLRIEDTLLRSAESDDPYDKRRLLLISENAVTLLHERDVLIIDSEPFNSVVASAADPGVRGFFVEAARLDGEDAILNVFEAGSMEEYVKHLREAALPCDSVVFYYGRANALWVKNDDYRQAPDQYQERLGQPLEYCYYLPENMRDMDRLMGVEMSRRLEYDCGDMESDIKSISVSPEKPPPPPEKPTADKKPSIGEKLRAGKKKADASRAKDPAATTKKREKEID